MIYGLGKLIRQANAEGVVRPTMLEQGVLRLPAQKLGGNAAGLDHVKRHGLGHVDHVRCDAVRIISDRERHLSGRTNRKSFGGLDEPCENHIVAIKRLRTGLNLIFRVPHLRAVRDEPVIEKILGAVAILVDEWQRLGSSTGTVKRNHKS